MRRSKRKTCSPYARAKPNKSGKNKATHHEENEENPRDAVPVVQPETAMSSGTRLSTSETSEVVRQPITEMADLLKWITSSGGNIPPNSVQGGFESYGSALYIGRALHNGNWYAGKCACHLNGCLIGYNGDEIVCPDFEILTLPPECEQYVTLSWHKSENGKVPDNALCVDQSMEFYVGRTSLRGGVHPGNIQCKKKTISVSFYWKQFEYKQYEVLVVIDERPVENKLTYDLDKIENNTNDIPLAIASQPATNNSDS